jgi:microcystin-dependent protein
MSTPFVGEIRLFAGNFPPNGWLFCDGQILSIAENDVLFNLIGTTYGGDGQNTFAVPDLRGRVPVHQGNGASPYVIGQQGGTEAVALASGQMAPHSHALMASMSAAASTHGPSESLGASATMKFYGTGAPNMAMDPNSVAPAGAGQSHQNMAPFVAMSFIISLFGIFPSQN